MDCTLYTGTFMGQSRAPKWHFLRPSKMALAFETEGSSFSIPEFYVVDLEHALSDDGPGFDGGDVLEFFCAAVVSASARFAGANQAEADLRELSAKIHLQMYSLQRRAQRVSELSQRIAASNRVTTTAEHALLGVEPGATVLEIRAAYHRKVREWQPDQLQNMAPEPKAFPNEQLGRINAAYEQLSSPNQ